jgi:hypothetical protein
MEEIMRPTRTEARADAAAFVVRHAHASVAAVARQRHVRPEDLLDEIIEDLGDGEPDREWFTNPMR